jgi:hypothetical protein
VCPWVCIAWPVSLKTQKGFNMYFILCRSNLSDDYKYVLATSRAFFSIESADTYLNTIHPSLKPFIVESVGV